MRKRTYFSALPLAFLLFFSGLFVLLLVKALGLSSEVESKSPIVVEMQSGLSQDGLEEVIRQIKSQPNIVANSVQWIDREKAMQMMHDALPDLISWEMDNPFRDVVTFRVEPGSYSDARLNELNDDLRLISGVSAVFYQESISDEATQFLKRIGLFAGLINALLLLVVVFLMQDFIHSLIRQEKNKIRIMEMVGATRKFIRAPFMADALKLGAISVMWAAIFFILLVIYLNKWWLTGFQVGTGEVIISLISIALLGLIVAVVGTYIRVNIYLRQIYQSA